jgi:hypothetical protein
MIGASVVAEMAAAGRGRRAEGRMRHRTNNTYLKLLECVTLEGVREHQAQFQKIADNNDDPFCPGSSSTPCYHLACDTFDNVDLYALESTATSSRSRS